MLQIGRQGQLYVVQEASYGVHPGHAATDAVRHVNFNPTYDPKNKRHSPEKKQSPGRVVRFDGRETAEATLEALIRPSGTLNTVPEADEIFEAAFGSKTNVILATTFNAGATVSNGTLASGAGLQVNDALLVTCPDGKRRVRFLTSVAGNDVTWGPDLPAGQAPATGAAAKGCLTYKLTTALAIALAVSHYLKKTDQTAGFKRGIVGWALNQLSLAFDANEEPRFTASGPAKTQTTSTTPAQPGGFTTVGGNPPSGLLSEFLLGDQAAKYLSIQLDLGNAMKLRNDENGASAATEAYRVGYREVTVGFNTRAEDEALAYDLAESGDVVGVFAQHGFTEGNIHAFRAPTVEFKVPSTDDGDEEVNWAFSGMALESADGANDELVFAFA
jgi:hypothetical protein